jgi:hypothetical protein
MKIKLIFVVSLLSFVYQSFAQSLPKFENGLIYKESTIRKLRRIGDSINIECKKHANLRDIYSIPQAYSSHFSLDSFNVKDAVRDMNNNMSFDEMVKKYPRAKINKNLITFREKAKNFADSTSVLFSTMDIGNDQQWSYFNDTTLLEKSLKNKWVYSYHEGNETFSESVYAFYFTTDFKSIKIPVQYIRMVQYCDCLTDSNSSVLVESALKQEPFWDMFDTTDYRKIIPAFYTLYHYVDSEMNSFREKYSENHELWMDHSDSILKTCLFKEPNSINLLHLAIEEGIRKEKSNEILEKLSAAYSTKENTLQLKRCRKVQGHCSDDYEPIIHTHEIATLAAECSKWSIFLRAHLDILNDRFERITDANHAQDARKTYIKELEKLNIDMPLLSIGTALQIRYFSKNHYFSSASRLGRALIESKDYLIVEKILLNAIKDDELDDYNRLYLYYTYISYINNLTDINRKKNSSNRLKQEIKSLPSRFYSNLSLDKLTYLQD